MIHFFIMKHLKILRGVILSFMFLYSPAFSHEINALRVSTSDGRNRFRIGFRPLLNEFLAARTTHKCDTPSVARTRVELVFQE